MKVVNYRAINTGALMAFVDIEIPQWKLVIRSIAFFQKNGKRWVTMPSKKIESEGEEDKYFHYLRFTDRDTNERFVTACIKAIDEYIMSEHV